MTVGELAAEKEWLTDYQNSLRDHDPDREWNQVVLDLDVVTKLLERKRNL